MTDAEMVKAMEICKDKEIPCDDCPLVECGDCEGISRQYFYDRFKQLQSENAALRERLDKAVELPCKIGDRFYIVEYYPPEIIEEECCDFSFIELSKILLDNGCGVTYELGDNGCFFVTLDKNEAIRIYNQKKEEQND